MGSTYTAMHQIEEVLNKEGIETVYVNVPSNCPSCAACNACENGNGCIKRDIVNDTYNLLDECDGIIVGSPVYYAGPSGSLLSFLDRLFYSYRNSLNMKAAIALSNSRRAGNITANDVINKFFSINGMTIITSTYWNDSHGFTPEDVFKDEENIQTMHNLGKNMAYYLKMRKLAKENNLAEPDITKDKFTHFIR